MSLLPFPFLQFILLSNRDQSKFKDCIFWRITYKYRLIDIFHKWVNMILLTHTHTSTDFPTNLNLCTCHVPVYLSSLIFINSFSVFRSFRFYIWFFLTLYNSLESKKTKDKNSALNFLWKLLSHHLQQVCHSPFYCSHCHCCISYISLQKKWKAPFILRTIFNLLYYQHQNQLWKYFYVNLFFINDLHLKINVVMTKRCWSASTLCHNNRVQQFKVYYS